MIHIEFDPNSPNSLTEEQQLEWQTINAEREEATKELIQKWETTGKITTKDFDSNFWSQLKGFLLDNVFNNKCAYCETHLGESRQPGDADHYRPKGGVNFKTKHEKNWKTYSKARTVDYHSEPEQELNHPGYFWLAYDWKNLLPTCIECNRNQGKKNQFPVFTPLHTLNLKLNPDEAANLTGQYYKSTSGEDVYYPGVEDLNVHEQPRLLHPYFGEDPADHLEFKPDGRVSPREINGEESEYGKASISAYNLWDKELRDAREKAQRDAEGKFLHAFIYHRAQGLSINDARSAAIEQDLTVKSAFEKRLPHSAAIIDFLKTWTLTLHG